MVIGAFPDCGDVFRRPKAMRFAEGKLVFQLSFCRSSLAGWTL